MSEEISNDKCSCNINCEYPRDLDDATIFTLGTISESGSCGPTCEIASFDEYGCTNLWEKEFIPISGQHCTITRRERTEEEFDPCCGEDPDCIPDNNPDTGCSLCILEKTCSGAAFGKYPRYEGLIDLSSCNPLASSPVYDPEATTFQEVAYYFASQNGASATRVLRPFYVFRPPSTCYLKVWFKEKYTTYGITGICGDSFEEIGTTYSYAGSVEITPKMFANNNGFCLENPKKSIFDAENSTSNHLGILFQKELVAGLNSSKALAVWKWSFVPDYVPDDGSESYPFEQSTIPRINGDGYPATGRQESEYQEPSPTFDFGNDNPPINSEDNNPEIPLDEE